MMFFSKFLFVHILFNVLASVRLYLSVAVLPITNLFFCWYAKVLQTVSGYAARRLEGIRNTGPVEMAELAPSLMFAPHPSVFS